MHLPGRLPGVLALLTGCAPVALAGPECGPVRTGVELPGLLDETSGAAFGTAGPGVVWSHNDGGSTLFAVDTTGTVLGFGEVRPRLRDWEDLAAGACDAHGSCLYLADTGDNRERRPDGQIRILRLAEPTLPATRLTRAGSPRTAPTARAGSPPTLGPEGPLRAEVFPIRLPDGPRDVEAVFVLPGERIHVITKGRRHAITVYRYPPPLRPDTVTLVEVQRLTSSAQPIANQVTGASASADGRTVAVRTYQSLAFYGVEADTLQPLADGLVNLRTLAEAQGEAVALGPGGLVALTSEGGPFGGAPAMNLLRCSL